LEPDQEIKGSFETFDKGLSASEMYSGELVRRGLGPHEPISRRPNRHGNVRQLRLNFLSTNKDTVYLFPADRYE
jgi:hypothetical protein